MTARPPLDLSDFRFTASIDYVTLKGLTKELLPSLEGKAKWPRRSPGKLTVHDATAADIQSLAEIFPLALIDELEVSVDIRTAQPLKAEVQHEALKAFKAEFVAKRLMPTFIDGTNSGFRGAYDHVLNRTIPYNYRVPTAFQQLLNGHRNDGVQVKCYFKRSDQRKALPVDQHCIRVEVRMNMVGLNHHSLVTVRDLIGFKFRKELMAYFTHVCGSRLRRVRKTRRTPLLDVLHSKLNELDLPHWERIGVGAFLPGGKRQKPNLVFKRDIALNDRIGQALGRLERSFAVEKFVRFLVFPNERRRVSTRVSA
ncbi:hypothetical protein B2J86_08070 [Acidovorax sp. SRB_14]|uniref:hypothetical protein n=1 Tax=Acidovorax sp. SRB_14 TaxID=1962699 RepID=UPI00156644D7|nr:hypothetical protein [Acidovorax sp. SRB_14]NMM80881.1 hypothetical protein [Acidovorax sp. SRB_14]